MNAEDRKEDYIRVTKSMLRTPCGVIPGDIIHVDFTKKPRRGEIALFSYMTTQYIKKFYRDRPGVHVYKIKKVIMDKGHNPLFFD